MLKQCFSVKPTNRVKLRFGDKKSNPVEIFSINDLAIIRFVRIRHALASASLNSKQKATNI